MPMAFVHNLFAMYLTFSPTFFVVVGSSNVVGQREFQSKLNSKTMTKKLQKENVYDFRVFFCRPLKRID